MPIFSCRGAAATTAKRNLKKRLKKKMQHKKQIENFPNDQWSFCHTTREGLAEELPVPDGSVDLLTASSAAHWFDQSRFLAEANRVLKVGGCVALLDYILSNSRLHYQGCGDRLTDIFKEVGHSIFNCDLICVFNNRMCSLPGEAGTPATHHQSSSCISVQASRALHSHSFFR